MNVAPPAGGGGVVQPDAAVCGPAGRHEGGGAGGRQAIQEDDHQLLPALPGRTLLLDHPHQVNYHHVSLSITSSHLSPGVINYHHVSLTTYHQGPVFKK